MKFFARLRVIQLAAVAITAWVSVANAADPPAADAPTRDGHNVHRVEKYAHVAAFLNLGQGTVRIVAVVPTASQSSLGVVDTLASMLEGTASKRLRIYVILRGGDDADSSLHAAVLAGRASDPRIVYFWDPTGAVAQVWDTHDTSCAWLYDTSAKFADQPPTASLVVVAAPPGKGLRLEGGALRAQSRAMVRRVEAKMNQPGDGL